MEIKGKKIEKKLSKAQLEKEYSKLLAKSIELEDALSKFIGKVPFLGELLIDEADNQPMAIRFAHDSITVAIYDYAATVTTAMGQVIVNDKSPDYTLLTLMVKMSKKTPYKEGEEPIDTMRTEEEERIFSSGFVSMRLKSICLMNNASGNDTDKVDCECSYIMFEVWNKYYEAKVAAIEKHAEQNKEADKKAEKQATKDVAESMYLGNAMQSLAADMEKQLKNKE